MLNFIYFIILIFICFFKPLKKELFFSENSFEFSFKAVFVLFYLFFFPIIFLDSSFMFLYFFIFIISNFIKNLFKLSLLFLYYYCFLYFRFFIVKLKLSITVLFIRFEFSKKSKYLILIFLFIKIQIAFIIFILYCICNFFTNAINLDRDYLVLKKAQMPYYSVLLTDSGLDKVFFYKNSLLNFDFFYDSFVVYYSFVVFESDYIFFDNDLNALRRP